MSDLVSHVSSRHPSRNYTSRPEPRSTTRRRELVSRVSSHHSGRNYTVVGDGFAGDVQSASGQLDERFGAVTYQRPIS